VEVQDVLQYSSMDELRSYLIDQKVDALAYRGFIELAEWMETIGIKGIERLGSFATAAQAIEIRNCIVHKRGNATNKYVKMKYCEKVGQKLVVTLDEVFVAFSAYCDVAKYCDAIAIEKFGVAKKRDVAPHSVVKQTRG
jgi:hypothetical protein